MNRIARMTMPLVALVFGVAAAPPPAKPVEEREVATGKVRLEAERGYIFLHAPTRLNGMFLRVPDDTTREAYQKDWEEAFGKAQKRYLGAVRRWQSDVRIAQQTKKTPPPRPEEPTRETFAIEPVELRDAVSFGPMFVFNKAEDRFSYLTSVKPGTYIWYGSVTVLPQGGAGGTCACMGTVKFEVKPGAVTNLGNYLQAAPEPARTHDVLTLEAWARAEEKAARTGKLVDPGFLARPALDFAIPASLAAWPTAKAEFTASGKLNNYYGVLISRLPPIPGVLAYRRDTVIDARSETALDAPPIESRQKPKR